MKKLLFILLSALTFTVSAESIWVFSDGGRTTILSERSIDACEGMRIVVVKDGKLDKNLEYGCWELENDTVKLYLASSNTPAYMRKLPLKLFLRISKE